jgi:myo-inositol-1-phosphate synthase
MSAQMVPDFTVESDAVTYDDEYITARYNYQQTEVRMDGGKVKAIPVQREFTFRTERRVPRIGVAVVGLAGNNGSTVTAGILANRLGLTWRTKEGEHTSNYFGSVTQSSTVRLGSTAEGDDIFVPLGKLLPMVNPSDMEIFGWDINNSNLADAMERAKVFDYDLQRQLRPHMEGIVPRPSIYYPDWIAANQGPRANHILPGSNKQAHLDQLRNDLRDFKKLHRVDKVIVMWSANTERCCEIIPGVNDTADNILHAIQDSHSEIAPSHVFAIASILEGCTFINGSPQNTLVPGIIDLAERHQVQIAGDDFKSGQTKFKSVLVDFLINAGIKVSAIASYNHLGNNDGKNLTSEAQFKSKEISKRGVVDDMVDSNPILYKPGEHPDHVIVIKYIPSVGDSKRALDEYTSEIFMGGKNTIVVHNTCEDSLLAAPLIMDLIILAEISQRIMYKTPSMPNFENFHAVNTLLSYLLKAPQVPAGTPVVNALFSQRAMIENVFKACVGLYPEHHMMMEHRTGLTSTSAAAASLDSAVPSKSS